MPYSNSTDNLGNKLMPKLIAAVTQSVIATKKGLMPTEHKLRVSAMQTIIDRAGHEVADLYRPLILPHIDNAQISPEAEHYIRQVISGEHQWQALAGLAVGQVAGAGGLSLILSNELAPLVNLAIENNPHLTPQANVIADAWAKGLIDENDTVVGIARGGFHSGWATMLQQAAQTIPEAATLFELYNRGYMGESELEAWAHRAGIPPELIQRVTYLKQSILTIADAALAVLRSDIDYQAGLRIAEENGYSPESFNIFLGNTGEPPGAQTLQEAWRRGFIDEERFKRGILQSRIRDEWIPTLVDMRFEPPSTADVIQASIQGYMTKENARKYALQNGLEAAAFDPLWLTAGEPLSRTEMQDLWNRGEADEAQFRNALKQSRLKDEYIDLATHLRKRPMTVADAIEARVQGYIDETLSRHITAMNGLRDEDYDPLYKTAGNPLPLMEALRLHRMGKMTLDQVKQALRESRLKDKYIDQALDLSVVIPPLFEIRLMLTQGTITDELASKLLIELGYQPEVVKSILAASSAGGHTANKAVTEGMLVDLYLETAITASELLELLTDIGYSKANAALIKEVADWKIELAARNNLISHTRTLYVARKIDEATAHRDLSAANVPALMLERLLSDWNLERIATVKGLTAAQIVDAWQLGLYEGPDTPANTQLALEALEQLGYPAADALMLLEIKNKGPLTEVQSGKPKKGTPNAGGATGATG